MHMANGDYQEPWLLNKGHMAQGGEPSLTMFQHYHCPLQQTGNVDAKWIKPLKGIGAWKNQYTVTGKESGGTR